MSFWNFLKGVLKGTYAPIEMFWRCVTVVMILYFMSTLGLLDKMDAWIRYALSWSGIFYALIPSLKIFTGGWTE